MLFYLDIWYTDNCRKRDTILIWGPYGEQINVVILENAKNVTISDVHVKATVSHQLF